MSSKHNFYRGIAVEHSIIDALDNHRYGELSPHWRRMIRFMYGDVDLNTFVYAKSCDLYGKPDIEIDVKGQLHYLSVKSGEAKAVHSERINVFSDWLKNNSIDENIIKDYQLYHFGDATLDGKGERRMGHQEVMTHFSQQIADFNESFRTNKEVAWKFVERVVFKGNNPMLPGADFLYHGDAVEGVICSKEQVRRFVYKKPFSYFINPHVAMLQLHPAARYTSGIEKDPEKRYIVEVSWPNMKKDISFIGVYMH